MSESTCDWRLFVDKNRDCLICEDYEKCRYNKLINDPTYIKNKSFMTDGVIEDDAIEYAAFLKELDRINDELLLSDLGLIKDVEEEDPEVTTTKISKGLKELTPIINFLDAENIPSLFNEPNDLFIADFMMITYLSPNVFSVKLTSLKGVHQDIIFMKQTYKSVVSKRKYSYSKKTDFNTMLTVVRGVVFCRKNNA